MVSFARPGATPRLLERIPLAVVLSLFLIGACAEEPQPKKAAASPSHSDTEPGPPSGPEQAGRPESSGAGVGQERERRDSVESLLVEGNRLLDSGRPAEARALAEGILARDPGNASAESLLGHSLYLLQDAEGAKLHLGRAAASDPGEASARLHLAILLLDEGADEPALAHLREACTIDPKHEEIRFRLGEALERSGDLEGAEAEFHEALRLGPDHAGALFRLGEVLRAKGEEIEAAIALETHRRLSPLFDRRDALLSSVSLEPEVPRHRLELARVYLSLGAGAKALRQAQEAAARSPGSVEVLEVLAEAAEAAGVEPRERVEVRRLLLEADPDSPARARDLARALAQAGRQEEALALLAERIAERGGDPGLWTGIGGISRALGRKEKAESAFREAIRIDSEAWEATSHLSDLLLETGRGGEALEILSSACDRAPDAPERRSKLATTLAGLDRIPEATVEARKAAESPRGRPIDAVLLGNLLLDGAGDLGDARRLFEGALARDPLLAEAFHGLGETLLREGKREESIAPLLRASILRPDREDWRLSLARLLRESGRNREAERWERRAGSFP